MIVIMPADDAERHAGHGGREKCAYRPHDDLPRENFREVVEDHDRERAEAKQGHTHGNRLALATKTIDKCTHRRLRDEAGDSARGNDNADVARIPVERCGEVNCEKRPEPSVHIGHEKVDRIERAQCLPARFDFFGAHDQPVWTGTMFRTQRRRRPRQQ